VKDLEPTIDPRLYQNRKAFEAETVYEVTTARDGLPFGIAIADIEQSQLHVHRLTTETYTVVQGRIELALDEARTNRAARRGRRGDPSWRRPLGSLDRGRPSSANHRHNDPRVLARRLFPGAG
jgi:hypothetical protein